MKIVSNVPIVVAERVIYTVNNVDTSYSETMALPNNQLDTIYWLPGYDSINMDSQLRFANVSSSTATIHFYAGGVEITSNCTPSNSPFLLAAGASKRVTCSGVNSGPVKIVSDVPIVAGKRILYKVNGVDTSFSKMMGLPAGLLDTGYWLPWYNNMELNTQLRFGVP